MCIFSTITMQFQFQTGPPSPWLSLFFFFFVSFLLFSPQLKYTPIVDVAGLGSEKLILYVKQNLPLLLANVDRKEKKRNNWENELTQTVKLAVARKHDPFRHAGPVCWSS